LRSEKGFTLVEVLIGLAILGLIGVVLLTSLTISAKSNFLDYKMSQAETLARAQVENIQSQPYSSNINNYSVMGMPADCSGFVFTPTPMVSPMATPDNGLQKITVTVVNGTTSYTLEDYKVNK